MTTLTAEKWPKVMLDQSNKCLTDILDAVDVEMSQHYPTAIKTEHYYKRVQPKLEEAREAIEEAFGLFGEDWPRYGGSILVSLSDWPGHFIPDKDGTYRFVPDYRRPVLDEVMTISEASERYGVPVTTIKSACAGQKGNPPAFTEYECRKSGKTWLVTKAGMDRLYGGRKDGKD
mgnify:FL=1